MRHVHVLVLLATTLGLTALNCGGEEGTLPATAGTSGVPGNAASGAGMSNVTAGSGGTAPGAVGSSGGHASGAGGATGGAPGGAGTAAPSGGAPSIGAGGFSGTLASAGFPNAGGPGAITGGGAGASATGGAGATAGAAATAGTGQGGGAGGGAGSAAVGPCGAVTGASFTQVAAIITTSCGTNDCHPNDKRMHTDLHNTDGKLLSRLLGNAPVSVKPECQNRPLVVPCSPDTSLLMQKIGANEDAWAGCGKRMPDDCPEKRACLSGADVETIRSWIAAGALP